ncbi:MAG: FecR family protein [Proteobacteria bacterium]|nr:FecR family protein [Pseudomonadota bacterium]
MRPIMHLPDPRLTSVLRMALCVGLFAWMGLVAPAIAAADVVGEVIFAIGDAKAVDAAGTHAVRKGDKVMVGQTLTSGDSGHIHVRFVDKAFVSVRPHSTLRIDTYTYSAEKPAASFVKFTLATGTARLITGAAGHAAKENFRLNTPVAAIGVRGTDFVVNTTAETTRVSVNEGAIAMSPLSGDCRADGFGPCQSDLARQLTSSTANAYLELRSRSAAPVLQSTDAEAPNRVTPPRPEEPRTTVPDKSQKSGSTSSEVITEVVAATVQRVTTPTTVTPPPVTPPPVTPPPVTPPPVPPVTEVPPVVVAPPPPPPAAKVWWGRWSDYAPSGSAGSFASVLTADRETAVSNVVFGLVVEKNSAVELPTSGVVGFTLADSEAYRKVGTTLTPAAVSDAALTMDFGKRSFDTSLIWKQGGQSIAINASGNITWQGIMISDASRSNAEVVGALTAANSQAGYLFSRPIDASATAIGATRWIR